MIGYIPNSLDCSHPADRRRFCYHADRLGISYEIATFDKFYDVVVVSIAADLEKWCKYGSNIVGQKKPYIIFDYGDMYLQTSGIGDILRGIYYSITRRSSSFICSYKNSLLRMFDSADTIICCSPEQAKLIKQYHDDVRPVLDVFDDEIEIKKTNYELTVESELHVFWEGFSHGNRRIFIMLRDILSAIQGRNVHLHIMTDPVYCYLAGSYMCCATYSLLSKLFKNTGVTIHLYDWNPLIFSRIASKCDMALIPIPDNSMMQSKPESKLILMWKTGLPVIATPIASYKRVLNNAGLSRYLCSNIEGWQSSIQNLAVSSKIRSEYINHANHYLKQQSITTKAEDVWHCLLNH